MLPKKSRLDLKKDFPEIRRNGKLLRGRLFDFLFQKLAADFFPPTFAFIVSKKIDKRAAKRNRIKRLLSETVRNFLPQLKPGIKGVFLAKKEILEKNFAEIRNEVEAIFKKENLLK